MKIEKSLESIRYAKQGKVILLSHLGRPKGREEKFSLRPCKEALELLLGKEVLFAEDCLGENTKRRIQELRGGDILLLENLRFYEGEEHPEKDPSFAKTLASYGDLYVNDAFAASHRNHGSITEIPRRYFPQAAAAGFLLEREVAALKKLLTNPPKPFYAMIGGSKISSKLGIIQALLPKVDALFIGGAMAFTFLKATGKAIGDSLFEGELIPAALDLVEGCKKTGKLLFLPEDIVFLDEGNITIGSEGKGRWKGMDIGPKTVQLWSQALQAAGSIFWNGPMGVFEDERFCEGTFSLIRFLSILPSYRVVGGGDSAAAVRKLGLEKKFSHISTGGGASLEWIEYGTLPGIEALTKKSSTRKDFPFHQGERK